jgi:hypothetical protein
MFKPILAALFTCLVATQAQSATVILSGTNFDVGYDDTLLGYYGTPVLSGNVVYFTPVNFKAESLNGGGLSVTGSFLSLAITPKNGFAVGNLSVAERGDYILRNANSSVTVNGYTRAYSSVSPAFDNSAPIVSTSDLQIVNSNANSALTHDWTASSSIDLVSLHLPANFPVNFEISTTLSAFTGPGIAGPKRAFIEQKFTGLALTVSPIPEPSSSLSLLVGLSLIGFYLKRKQRK